MIKMEMGVPLFLIRRNFNKKVSKNVLTVVSLDILLMTVRNPKRRKRTQKVSRIKKEHKIQNQLEMAHS